MGWPHFSFLQSRSGRDLRLAAKVATAAGLAFVVASLAGLPQGYWSVITAVVVVQGSVASTVIAARERAAGTILGAAVGGAVALLHPQSVFATSLALSLSVAALAFAAAGRPALKIAPVTAAILIVATVNPGGSFELALERILEIFVGCAIGIAVTFAVFPTRLHHELLGEGAEIARDLAGLLRDMPGWAADSNAAHKLLGAQDRIRRRLSGFERAVVDARKAPGSSALAQQRGALVRALWRVRNDATATARALAGVAGAKLVDVLTAAETALADQADRLDAVARRVAPDDGAEPAASLRGLEETVQALRAGETSPESGTSSAMAALGLQFALTNLDGNVRALAERMAEAAEAT